MSDLLPVSREEKIAALHREIALRVRVYGRYIAEGKMDQSKADREIEIMRAILADYEKGNAVTNRDTLVTGKKIVLAKKGTVVALEVHCGDEYEASVLFEDIDDRFKRGEMVGIHAARKP